MTASVRRAIASDLEAIRDVLRHSPEAGQWSDSVIERLAQAGHALVAEGDGRIAGFIVARAAGSEWEIENVAVEPDLRRSGIARQLVTAVVAQARSAHATAIFLEVRESNLAARELYRSLGFVESGNRSEYYRSPSEAAVIYKLVFNPELDLD
jgi:ribosomal-protein-alanine N-acetyltransferase